MADKSCCGCVTLDDGVSYNLGLHIGTVFIMFFVSAAGTLVPFVFKRFQSDPEATPFILDVLFSFSFGIVLACGLIHMINDGIERLSSECLGSITQEYGAWGLAIVLVTLVALHFIECESTVFMMGKASSSLSVHHHGHVQHNADSGTTAITPDPSTALAADDIVPKTYSTVSTKDTVIKRHETSNSTPLRKKIAAVIFEVGVIFHSVIIGLDLGVTGGNEFVPLLIAICFHQFFEGVAIGGSSLRTIRSTSKLLLMNLMFAITTPLGLAIGIAARTSYSDSSLTALWVEGVLDCIAGGILFYNGLVELMTYNMTTNDQFLSRSPSQRAALHAALWFGAGAMALIGKWA